MRFSVPSFALEVNAHTASASGLIFEGKNLLGAPSQKPLFTLWALNPSNERIELHPGNGRQQGDALVFEQMFYKREAVNIHVTLRALEKEGALAFTLQVENNDSAYCVIETLFELCGLTFGEDEATILYYPHHAGERIPNPAQRLRSEKYQGFWRGNSKKINGEWVRECNYCGLCSMSYMYLQSPCASLYFASHDLRFPVTGLITKTGGEAPAYLSMGFRIHKRIQHQEAWKSGEFTIHLSNSTWHAGARRYWNYLFPHLPRSNTPAFLRSQAALNQCYNFKRGEEIQNRFSRIPEMWEAGMRHGINHMFIASWNRTGFDSFYPEYYPDMELGTAMEFKRGIEEVNARGGFVTLYVNARLSDISSDFHKHFLNRMRIERIDGSPVVESYGPHEFTLNCPSDRQWQRMLVDICDFAAHAYGVKGIYLDQLASAEPYACYNTGHTHEDIGEFNTGYVAILSELLTRLRKRDENAYLMTENCGDIYGPYVWGNLTWNGAAYDEFFNLFRYTFPEFVQVNMCNERTWEKDAAKREQLFYDDIQRCVLMGNILWIGITSHFRPESDSQARLAYVLIAAAFRKQIARQVTDGVYMDDEYVKEIDPPLQASSFRVSDTEALLLVGDSRQAGGQVCFRLPFEPLSTSAHDEFSKPVAVFAKGNVVRLATTGQRLVRITACTTERGNK